MRYALDDPDFLPGLAGELAEVQTELLEKAHRMASEFGMDETLVAQEENFFDYQFNKAYVSRHLRDTAAARAEPEVRQSLVRTIIGLALWEECANASERLRGGSPKP